MTGINADIKGLIEHLNSQPLDVVARRILADALEDAGEADEARTHREGADAIEAGKIAAGSIGDRQLSVMDAWDIARAYGLSYSGDRDVLNHGGYFYSTSEWESWGYAATLDFWTDDDNTLRVEERTVNRQEGDRLERAMACVGLAAHDDNVHAQIDACHAYYGADSGDWDATFNLDTWKEHRIWKMVRRQLEILAQ